MIEDNNLSILQDAKCWLDRYFNGDRPQINELPLKPKGYAGGIDKKEKLLNFEGIVFTKK